MYDANVDGDVNGDSSYVDDPPSDPEDRWDTTTKKDKPVDFKDRSKHENVGIFDVVDVLTPASQT